MITSGRVLQSSLHVSEGLGHLLFTAHVQLEDVHPARAQVAQLLGTISSLVLANRQGGKPLGGGAAEDKQSSIGADGTHLPPFPPPVEGLN